MGDSGVDDLIERVVINLQLILTFYFKPFLFFFLLILSVSVRFNYSVAGLLTLRDASWSVV